MWCSLRDSKDVPFSHGDGVLEERIGGRLVGSRCSVLMRDGERGSSTDSTNSASVMVEGVGASLGGITLGRISLGSNGDSIIGCSSSLMRVGVTVRRDALGSA